MTETHDDLPEVAQDRRTFVSRLSTAAMAVGLAAGYGLWAFLAGRFLYPSRPRQTAWIFVSEVNRLKSGETMPFRIPTGQRVTITRRQAEGTADDFLALSSTCPHLGCQVHWEAQHERFFCPCHNGAFDADGTAIAGPPADAGQRLPLYPVKVERGLLFIQAPTEPLD